MSQPITTPLPDDINPGIRYTVEWLRENGFRTMDSGDGVTRKYECDPGIPYVHILVDDKAKLIAEADRLAALLEARGCVFEGQDESGRRQEIGAHYSAPDGEPMISLWNVVLEPPQ